MCLVLLFPFVVKWEMARVTFLSSLILQISLFLISSHVSAQNVEGKKNEPLYNVDGNVKSFFLIVDRAGT